MTPCGLTAPPVSSILRLVGVANRFSAVLLCVGLLAGNGAVCAGWAATAEARMACCADGACPMHRREPRRSGLHQAPAQAEADTCCAFSESEHSSRSTTTVVAAVLNPLLEPGIVAPPSVPLLVRRVDWRTTAPLPAALVPRHVLLSVFLV